MLGTVSVQGSQGVVRRDATRLVATKWFFSSRDLLHETRILRKLEGVQGVVQLLSYDEKEGFASMQDGGATLLECIQFCLPDDWHDLHLQVVSAVGALHALSVMHGDVKPDNILVDSDRVVRLCDFGHSLVLTDEERREASLTDRRGSLPYACPEILAGVPYDGFAADAWSAGIVLYAMVSGTCPFVEASEQCVAYTSFLDGVVRRSASPTATLIASTRHSVRVEETMCTPLFSQNLDVLLQPHQEKRMRMDGD